MKFLKSLLSKIKPEHLLIISILTVAGIAHAYNMFHFPYFEDDEGTYMSQAWSFLTQGQLAPYTYWYDHAPLGWIFIALWIKLVGGFFVFGTSVETGRVFMLVLHLFSTLFLYIITKRLTKSTFAATIASIIFSISPLAIYFQRRVLLDNIMTFWILFTLFILTVKNLKLRHIYLSALTMAVAILTKENAIFFIPGFLVLIAQRSHSYHKSFALIKWLAVVVLLTGFYVSYALLKGEFFPSGTLFGGPAPHVSLWSTIMFQIGRSGGSIFDPSHSLFWKMMNTWLGDKLLIIGGIFGTLFISLVSIKKRQFVPYALFSIFFWYYLMRGSVIEFYIVPLIPILALLLVLTIIEICERANNAFKNKNASMIVYLIVIIIISSYYFLYGNISRGLNIYTSDQTTAQLEALSWIRKNLSTDSIFAMDNYGYVDLHSPKNPSGLVYPYAEYYLKFDKDPAILNNVIKDNPNNINVLLMSPQASMDINVDTLKTLSSSIHTALPVKIFWDNGWGITIWQPRYPNQILLSTWNSYKKNFILPDGRTVDPANDNNTTSEAQSYALLRAVWENDQQQFDMSWNWTKRNMQLSNHLFGWQWVVNKKSLIDGGTASDADEDIALALAMASKKWNNQTYLDESNSIVNAIWNNEVKTINNKPFLVAGNWAKNRTDAIINPSYLAPYAYRIFSQIDTTHPWMKIVDSSYEVLNSCSSATLDKATSANLVPDWCAVTPNGQYTISNEQNLTSTNYSFDAFRSTWRIALDYEWNKDQRAKDLLEKNSFIRTQWNQNGKILVGYTHDGKPQENYESAVAYGADIGNFIVTDPQIATGIYKKELYNKFYEDSKSSYWEDPKNYYTQNWAWFGTALYSNNLPNLWSLKII